jgi:hypothetical protein
MALAGPIHRRRRRNNRGAPRPPVTAPGVGAAKGYVPCCSKSNGPGRKQARKVAQLQDCFSPGASSSTSCSIRCSANIDKGMLSCSETIVRIFCAMGL